MVTISILTPVYGVEKYIEQCARSLFEQSYAHIEYIFVDDCTKDKSISILESVMQQYPERVQQVQILHHPHNKGVGAARQTALMAAKGDYVMFVDSDDFLPKDAVENLVEKAMVSGADLIDGGYTEWQDGQAATLSQMPLRIAREKYLKLLLCQNIIPNRLWGRMYRRSLIMEHEIFFLEGIDYAEDLFWNAQFLFYGNRIWIDRLVYYYRTDNIHSYNHHISEKNLLSYFKSTHLLIAFFQQHDVAHRYRKAIEIGVVNAYRWAVQAHVPLYLVDEAVAYCPKSRVICGIIRLIRRGWSIKRVNLVYLSYRKIFVKLFCA